LPRGVLHDVLRHGVGVGRRGELGVRRARARGEQVLDDGVARHGDLDVLAPSA
jgi:hypothetical protein